MTKRLMKPFTLKNHDNLHLVQIISSSMENKEDQIPLQEIIYKPTTQSSTPTPLKPDGKSSSGFLFFTATVANLIAFTCGIGFGWTSPVIPKLTSNDTTINPIGRPITHAEESWIAGLVCLGAILGPLVAGTVAGRLGRKKTLLLISLPMVGSLIASAYITTAPLFYVARVVLGFGIGSTFTVLPIYLAEIAEDHNRGTLGCSFAAFLSFGILFDFVVGPYLSIRNFCLVCSVPLLIFIPVFAVWVPESPHFLASINRNKDLEVSLSKLRNKSPSQIQIEVSAITKAIFHESQEKGGFSDLFRVKGLRKGLVITLGLVIFMQFAGINAVLAYLQTIFNSTGSALAPEISTMIIGLIQVLTTVATSFLVDRLGRRILLLTSCIGSSVSLIVLGLFFHLKSTDFEVSGISWLPVASLVTFIIAFNTGLGPLPWAVMSELFPPNVKSVAATLTSVTCFVGAFIITLVFPWMVLAIGMAKSFWIFALVCFGAFIFIYCVLPETKGKSLQEIQRILEGSKL